VTAAAVYFVGRLLLVVPESLENDTCINAGVLAPHLLYAWLRHPRVAVVLDEEECSTSNRFVPGNVVARKNLIETLTTDPAPHRNQIGKIFVAAYLHHSLALEIVNQKKPCPASAL